jgi:hypothetical protein
MVGSQHNEKISEILTPTRICFKYRRVPFEDVRWCEASFANPQHSKKLVEICQNGGYLFHSRSTRSGIARLQRDRMPECPVKEKFDATANGLLRVWSERVVCKNLLSHRHPLMF